MGEVTNARGHGLSRSTFDELAGDLCPTFTIHRAAPHEVLLSSCHDLDLHAGTTVELLADRGDVVEANRSNGVAAESNGVISADGLRSGTRCQVFGETTPVYSGYACWRFVVECPPGLEHVQEMWGRGLRSGLVPRLENCVYSFLCANMPAGTEDPEEGRLERF